MPKPPWKPSTKPKWSPETLLASLLERTKLTSADLDDLAAHNTDESLHLEYKRGDWIEADDAPQELRRQVSGFANADGGVLIIGVDANHKDDNDRPTGPWTVMGCGTKRGDLYEWISRTLTEIASHLSPALELQLVEHPHGKIFAVAVARAPNLVGIGESKRVVYYLRMGDQTLKVPEYLHADLVLGRRSGPQIELKGTVQVVHEQVAAATLIVSFQIFNDGLSWVPEAKGCFLGYRQLAANTRPPPKAVMRYVSDGKTDSESVHKHMETLEIRGEIAPFAHAQLGARFSFSVPHDGFREWKGIFVLVPKNCPPIFAQIVCRVDGTGHEQHDWSCEQLPPGQSGQVSLFSSDSIG